MIDKGVRCQSLRFRIQVQSSQVKVDIVLEALLVAIAERFLYQSLYSRVQSFDRAIGYLVGEVVENLIEVALAHFGHLLHRRQAAIGSPIGTTA